MFSLLIIMTEKKSVTHSDLTLSEIRNKYRKMFFGINIKGSCGMATEQTIDIKRAGAGTTSDNGKAPTVKREKGKGSFKRDLPLYIMLLPGIIVLIVNNYIPMVGVIIPFENYINHGGFFQSIAQSQFTGFTNFQYLIQNPDALNATRLTILYNLLFISLDLVVPVALAIAMSEMWSKRLGNFYQTLMFLPYFISWIVVSYVVFSFFVDQQGFVNSTILRSLGISSIDFYADPKYWPFIVTFFHLWKYTGYNLIVYIAALSGISGDYYEAAALDGATKWQQIRHITLPMLKTTMVILTLLAVGRIFNGDFDLFFNVPNNMGALYPTTQVLDNYVYIVLKNMFDVGMSSAAGLYQAVVGCVVVVIANICVRKVDPESSLF